MAPLKNWNIDFFVWQSKNFLSSKWSATIWLERFFVSWIIDNHTVRYGGFSEHWHFWPTVVIFFSRHPIAGKIWNLRSYVPWPKPTFRAQKLNFSSSQSKPARVFDLFTNTEKPEMSIFSPTNRHHTPDFLWWVAPSIAHILRSYLTPQRHAIGSSKFRKTRLLWGPTCKNYFDLKFGVFKNPE